MSTRFTYVGLLILFFCASAFVVMSYRAELKDKANTTYPLEERKGASAFLPEWAATKKKASNLIRKVNVSSADTKSAIALATLYLQEARITGNTAYYDAAAMKYVDNVLAREPENFEALTLKSLIHLSQHHFSEALAVAEKAQKVGAYNAFVYGLLVDGNVEMGNYKAAVDNAERMVSLRPDIRSFSRISYLREIHGDYPGAIEAMKMAVKAGGVGDEPTSWSRIQLARLYEITGDLRSAEMHYTIALDQRPGYAYALAGLGHIASLNKDYVKAISLYERADSLVVDYSFKEKLAELYRATANVKKSETMLHALITNMADMSAKAKEDETLGHYADLELANMYLLVNKADKALEYAQAEYNRRPENIEVNEAMAWAYYKTGDAGKALPYLQVALKTGSKKPALLCKAGAIFAKTGQTQKGKDYLEAGLKNSASLRQSLLDESVGVLAQL